MRVTLLLNISKKFLYNSSLTTETQQQFFLKLYTLKLRYYNKKYDELLLSIDQWFAYKEICSFDILISKLYKYYLILQIAPPFKNKKEEQQIVPHHIFFS